MENMTDRNIIEFQKKFKMLRGEMSQQEFAEKIGIARATVGFYENGERLPNAYVLKKIALTFNCSVDWLLGLICDFTPINELIDKYEMIVSTLQNNILELKKLIE